MKRANILPLFIFFEIFFAATARAVCPVCVIAVGAGVGLSRWLGVDDAISGLWIGGLLVAGSWWTIIWLGLKNWTFKYYKIIIPAAYYILVLAPLYFSDIIGHPLNKIFGIDKILFGSVVGSLIFLGGTFLNGFLKKKNGGKVFFPYQKVAIPVIILIISSFILYQLLIWKTIK